MDCKSEPEKVIPETMKIDEDRAHNDFLNVSPSILRFPHDDPTKHEVKLVIWNRSKQAVTFRIDPPSTQHFRIIYGKTHLYAGTEETVMVKCYPKGQRIGSDQIRIYVEQQKTNVIVIPLELLPSSKWFLLPKTLTMPIIPVGQSYYDVIQLPSPPITEDAIYFQIKNARTDYITIEPAEGYIGSQPSATLMYTMFLTILYHPREYCTVAHAFTITFPGMENIMAPYEITVYLRCIPGLESEIILGTLNELQMPAELNQPCKKPKFQRQKLKTVSGDKPEIEDEERKVPNLLTTAAFMKFLMKPGESQKPASDSSNLLGVNDPKHRNQYKKMEADFHDQLNRLAIQQDAMHLKHTRAFHGEEPFEAQAERVANIHAEREAALDYYQKILGLHDNNVEDMKRTKLQRSNQRCIRDVDENYIPDDKASVSKLQFLAMDTKSPHHWAKVERLRRFIQAARLVITRKRADKRIVKLRVLIKETRHQRKLEALEQLRLAEIAQKEEERLALIRHSVAEVGKQDSELIRKTPSAGEQHRSKEKHEGHRKGHGHSGQAKKE